MNSLRLLPLLALTFTAAAHAAEKADMFPFQLSWDDASESATNISWLNDKPAGRDGFVHVKDGHLFAGEKRMRIFGVNTCFAANFPDKAMAPKVAARMAKFGINCVRFHHMDMLSAPGGIFAKDGRTLDPGQLDRLDFFIAELKKNGIYADLNLHVSRTYPDRPREEKKGNPDYDKGVDNYCAAMIALQKDYARDLLTHVNAYTGNRYADEPAVALVEINNENALGFQWWAGQMDALPWPYLVELEKLWGAWILKKHGSDGAACKAWSEGARAAGAEMIAAGSAGVPPEPSNIEKTPQRETPNTNQRKPTSGAPGKILGAAGNIPAQPNTRASRVAWSFETHGEAKATGTEKDGAIIFTIEKPGTEAWHAQFSAAPLRVVKDQIYEARFRVRYSQGEKREALSRVSISVALMQAHAPWKILGSVNVNAGGDWNEASVLIKTSDDEDNARLTIGGMGLSVGSFEFAGFSLCTAAVSGEVEGIAGRVFPVKKRELARHTPAKQRDWQEFIWDTETAYWNGMRDFLKKDLGVKAPVVGTQGFWSPGHVQAGMDVIDSHAYWHHPDFHGKGWNPDVWDVKNEPMAGAYEGGTLPGLAAQRVAGKPFLCTEYNHPAPNTYSAETFPLLCAFAALQDWDGVFAFSYSHRAGDAWSQEHFNNFFDIDRHPVKMATLPAAVISFRRGDVRAARETSLAVLTHAELLENALKSGTRIGYDTLQLHWGQAFQHRIAVQTGKVRTEAQLRGAKPFFSPYRSHYQSDTNEIFFYSAVRVFTPRSEVYIGKYERQSGVGLLPQKWACFQMTVLDRDERADFSTAKRILITATGDIENTGMGWKDAAKTSVGRDWGRAPVLVEGPESKAQLLGGGKFKAWALDERGQRRAEIPVTNGTLEIGPQHRTLWYEVERQ